MGSYLNGFIPRFRFLFVAFLLGLLFTDVNAKQLHIAILLDLYVDVLFSSLVFASPSWQEE